MKQVNSMNEWFFPIGVELNLPIYLVGVGSLANQEHITRPAGYPNYQVIYCTKGSGILRLNGTERLIADRQVIFLHPNVPHEYYAVEEPWNTHFLTFDGEAVDNLVKMLGFKKSGSYYLKDSFGIDDLWRQILQRAKSSEIRSEFHCSALIYQFLIVLMDSVSEEPPIPDDRRLSQFYTILSYIDGSFNEELSLSDLSRKIGVSQQYLCRLFKKYLKTRPFEYITRRRLQEAKKNLVQTDSGEAEIASRCGFNNISYFCAVFKRYEKITPAAFRSLYSHSED